MSKDCSFSLASTAINNQCNSLDSQSVTLLHIPAEPKQYSAPYKDGRSSAPLLKCMHNHSSPEGASSGSRGLRLRDASKLYGKRGAQDDHVAAKHRPAGMRGMRGAASRAPPAVTPGFRARVCGTAEASQRSARASKPPSTTGSRDPHGGLST